LSVELPLFLRNSNCKVCTDYQELSSKLQASVKSSLIECKYTAAIRTYYHSVFYGFKTPTVALPVIMYIPELNKYVSCCNKEINMNTQHVDLGDLELPERDICILDTTHN
jgi:hypothetical protein